ERTELTVPPPGMLYVGMMRSRIEALTGLRFFAAAAIVLHHLQGLPSFPDILGGAIPAQGVSVFFVLSGFILTLVHPALDEPGQTRKFYLARFARVWPAHIAVLAAVLLVMQRNPA